MKQSQPPISQWQRSWISFPKSLIMNKLLSLGLELRRPGESQDEVFPGENTALLGASLPQCMFALGSNSGAPSAVWG